MTASGVLDDPVVGVHLAVEVVGAAPPGRPVKLVDFDKNRCLPKNESIISTSVSALGRGLTACGRQDGHSFGSRHP